MSIEQELKNLILSKYNSIRDFAISIEMPYSTLDSIFKRGVENAKVGNIIKICNALSISADGLATGRIVYRSDSAYSNKETELLNLFRSLTGTGRDLALETVRTYAGNPDMQKDSQIAKAT